jgi:hypothetical protein
MKSSRAASLAFAVLMSLFNAIGHAVELAPYGAAAECNLVEAGKSVQFTREVIRTLGIDGKACYVSSGRTYCLSRSAQQPRAISIADFSSDDRLRVNKGLFLCSSTAGQLGSCVPAQAGGWDCDHYGPGPKNCHCTGQAGCIALASLPTCNGGSCGNCAKGECCCTAP